MQTIFLLNSDKVAMVDDEDYPSLMLFNWSLTIDGYVRCTMSVGERLLHRIIGKKLGFTDEVDHKDQNPLNCQRINLRNATRKQNSRNRKFQSVYKGVSFHNGKYQALIRVNGKLCYLGRFISIIEAARAYDKAAVEFFGEFASINGV